MSRVYVKIYYIAFRYNKHVGVAIRVLGHVTWDHPRTPPNTMLGWSAREVSQLRFYPLQHCVRGGAGVIPREKIFYFCKSASVTGGSHYPCETDSLL